MLRELLDLVCNEYTMWSRILSGGRGFGFGFRVPRECLRGVGLGIARRQKRHASSSEVLFHQPRRQISAAH